MLDTTVQARITLLVYADIAAAHDWLVRVFGLDPAGSTGMSMVVPCTVSCAPETA